LHEDLKIRKYVEKNMKNASIANTEISRTSDQVKVTVYTAKPGVAIGKKVDHIFGSFILACEDISPPKPL
jgi:ribosomal protein S3